VEQGEESCCLITGSLHGKPTKSRFALLLVVARPHLQPKKCEHVLSLQCLHLPHAADLSLGVQLFVELIVVVASVEDGCCILYMLGMGSAALQVCALLHSSPCRRIQDGRPQTLEVQEASIFQAASFFGARIHFPDVLHHMALKVRSPLSVQLCVLHIRKHQRSGRLGSHLGLRTCPCSSIQLSHDLHMAHSS
jgi:hypothetical protein